jgi:protein-tyrosine kinase
MTDDQPLRRRKPRLDAGERTRLLEEIAKIEAATGASVVPEATQDPARAARPASGGNTLPRVTEVWGNLMTIPVDAELLNRNLVITASRENPAHGAFDVLRTRLLQALIDNGWKKVGITSPTQGCGKSFTAINLAITLSRYDNCRTVLMDMDMRHPSIARYLGVANPPSMGDYLRGHIPTEVFLRKPGQNMLNIGRNMAVGLNSRTEEYAAELFHDPSTTEVLRRLDQEVSPDVVLYDLPPALAQDDVIAFRPHFDCLLIVAGGGMTTAKQMRETVRRIGEDKPVVGVVLNKAEGEEIHDYSY